MTYMFYSNLCCLWSALLSLSVLQQSVLSLDVYLFSNYTLAASGCVCSAQSCE